VRGHQCMNNDVVNFTAISIGASITMLLWRFA
jgi:hypothetical protein